MFKTVLIEDTVAMWRTGKARLKAGMCLESHRLHDFALVSAIAFRLGSLWDKFKHRLGFDSQGFLDLASGLSFHLLSPVLWISILSSVAKLPHLLALQMLQIYIPWWWVLRLPSAGWMPGVVFSILTLQTLPSSWVSGRVSSFSCIKGKQSSSFGFGV